MVLRGKLARWSLRLPQLILELLVDNTRLQQNGTYCTLRLPFDRKPWPLVRFRPPRSNNPHMLRVEGNRLGPHSPRTVTQTKGSQYKEAPPPLCISVILRHLGNSGSEDINFMGPNTSARRVTQKGYVRQQTQIDPKNCRVR